MAEPIAHVGLDVHEETIAVAPAAAGERGEVRGCGTTADTPAALRASAGKPAKSGATLGFRCEAGPCGCGIRRQPSAAGHECVVVAPSPIPRRPGERIETDRRDAINLAGPQRAGEPTPVWVPDQAHGAIRDPARARQAAVRAPRRARRQLSGFLPRHGHHHNRPAWTRMHRRWPAGLKSGRPAHHLVLEDAIAAVEAATARRDRLEAGIEAALPDRSPAPVVRAPQAPRGMAPIAAATPVAEPGGIARFEDPRQPMAHPGLVPSERSSGATRRQGAITRAGDGAARRMPIEAAWSCRFPARISREPLPRQGGLAKPIRDAARKAQERLCRRHRRLVGAGKPPTVATAAIAREPAGFVRAIARQARPSAA